MEQLKKYESRYKNLILFVFSVLLLCASGIICAVQTKPAPRPEIIQPAQTPATDPATLTIYDLIYTGDFKTAQSLIASADPDGAQLKSLAKVIDQHNQIQFSRQSTKQKIYAEQITELEKLQANFDSNTPAEPNEPNDINKTVKALSIIAKASDFADDIQKQILLEKPFVKKIIQTSIEKADVARQKGDWIEAYAGCYSWLTFIDEDNEYYKDTADQLSTMALIRASLTDSPCETRRERYQGVKKGMFTKTINLLSIRYVNRAINYSEMAESALKQCRLLGQVITTTDDPNTSFVGIDKSAADAWQQKLKTLEDEIKKLPLGISKEKFLEIFTATLRENINTINLPEELLIAQFAESSLKALDPYTSLIWPSAAPDFEKLMTNEFTGIGIEITKPKRVLTVGSLLPGTPAYNSGLDAGDIIEKVDGLDTKDMSLFCAVRKITGPAGTKVNLTVKSPGIEETKEIVITRARIIVPTIRGWQRTEKGNWRYFIDEKNKIGYVRLTNFSDTTSKDFEKVLKKLEAKGMTALILDLRYNSGGFLLSAIEITDKFISKGLIVSSRPTRYGSWTYESARKKGTHPNYPLVILINGASASASEIVAGALQDPTHKRAILVGDQSYGKGSVQTIIDYPGKGAKLKYTMAYYYLPSGQRVRSKAEMEKKGRTDWGIIPDVKVKLTSEEIKDFFKIQRDNDVLVKTNHDNGSAPLTRHAIKETLDSDPQLNVALLLAKTKLIETGKKVTFEK